MWFRNFTGIPYWHSGVCYTHSGHSRSNCGIAHVHRSKAKLWSIPWLCTDFSNRNTQIPVNFCISLIIHTPSEFLHKVNFSLIAFCTLCGILCFCIGICFSPCYFTKLHGQKNIQRILQSNRLYLYLRYRAKKPSWKKQSIRTFAGIGPRKYTDQNKARNKPSSPKGLQGKIPTSHPWFEERDKMIEKSIVFKVSVQEKKEHSAAAALQGDALFYVSIFMELFIKILTPKVTLL